MFNKVVKCPHCGSKNIGASVTGLHAVTYKCNNIKCHKYFTKEYK